MKERRQGIWTIRTNENKERTTLSNKERRGKEMKDEMRGRGKGK